MTATLTTDDVDHIARCLPKKVASLIGNGAVLAGGYIRAKISRERVADIDLFFRSQSAAELAAAEFDGPRARTENAITIFGKTPIQLIHKWTFPDAASVVDHFDFTVAKAAIFHDGEWRSRCDSNFYADLAAKRLNYTGSDQPGGSLLRMNKFIARGYRIAPEQIAKIVADLVGRCGISAASIAANLREVDPLSLARTVKEEYEIVDK